jgi:monoamine oxidase
MAHAPGFARLVALTRSILAQHLGPAPIVALGDAALSRRRFMVGGTLAGTAAVLSGCTLEDEPAVDVEIAVVGAGMAGTHCAYRLAIAGLDVRLYEATERVGGRMWTSRDGHPDGQLAELGGELIDSNHATLWCLSDEFGIELDDRSVGAPTGDTWVVGGVVVPDATIVEQFTAVAAEIAAAVEAADTDDDAYATLDETTLADYLDEVVPVTSYPELHAVLTAAYRGEFGLETSQQSALNLIYLIGSDDPDPFRIFGESDERWHAHGGSDTFVTRLAEGIDDDRIVLEHALTELHAVGDSYELVFTGPEGELVVRARHVVLAIPWTILRTIELGEAGLSAEKRALIDTLGYGANAKLMGWFADPLWRTQYGASGSLTSDGPIQQTWDTAIGQTGTAAVMTNFLGGDAAAGMTATAVQSWWATTILPELDAIWPGVSTGFMADSPISMLWPSYAWTLASYTCYLPGQWATWATEGEREGNVHFCGEHCSADFQGWMEGAAETGALVAAALIEEYGAELSPELSCILASKLVVEQPGFDGKLSARPRWRARRAALRRAAAELHARRRALQPKLAKPMRP